MYMFLFINFKHPQLGPRMSYFKVVFVKENITEYITQKYVRKGAIPDKVQFPVTAKEV